LTPIFNCRISSFFFNCTFYYKKIFPRNQSFSFRSVLPITQNYFLSPFQQEYSSIFSISDFLDIFKCFGFYGCYSKIKNLILIFFKRFLHTTGFIRYFLINLSDFTTKLQIHFCSTGFYTFILLLPHQTSLCFYLNCSLYISSTAPNMCFFLTSFFLFVVFNIFSLYVFPSYKKQNISSFLIIFPNYTRNNKFNCLKQRRASFFPISELFKKYQSFFVCTKHFFVTNTYPEFSIIL